MDKNYFAGFLLSLAAGSLVYVLFLGEMGRSSFFPIRDVFLNNITTVEGVQEDHYKFFSERIELSEDQIDDPWAGVNWLLGAQPSCELVGDLLAYAKVREIEKNATVVKSGIKEGLNAVISILNSSLDLSSQSSELVEFVRYKAELNVTLDRFCIANSYGDSLQDFAEWEGNKILSEYFRGFYVPAEYRSEVMVILWKDLS